MSYFIDFLVMTPLWFVAMWIALGILSSYLVWTAISEARRDDDDA